MIRFASLLALMGALWAGAAQAQHSGEQFRRRCVALGFQLSHARLQRIGKRHDFGQGLLPRTGVRLAIIGRRRLA